MKNLDLGKDSIRKLLIAFCVPCVISMLINSVYNIMDQIFIGKGVGTFGNGATNVIFPLILIFNGVASLIGTGAAAGLSLKLGAGKKEEATKSVGQAITVTIVVSILLAIVSYVFLPKLVLLLGCTENVYSYAMDYGRIIVLGAPFMIFFTALSNIIRADGSPRYSMNMLIIGAIINLVLDPILIFGLNMGVKGGAIATVTGQVITAIIAAMYLKKFKTITLTKKHFKIDSDVWNTLALGLSSFITQATVLALFVYMNNVLTRFGADSVFGADIPLALYGVMQKINTLFISMVLGITIGAQPIIGYNYGAREYQRVSQCLKTVIAINMVVGVLFNVMFFFFPTQLAGLFITAGDANYDRFMEFATLMCHSFLLVMAFNALEMTCSTSMQALGKVKKATVLALLRQVILLIPISLTLAISFEKGIYGILYAGAISDSICFLIAVVLIGTEFALLKKQQAARN